MKRRNIFIKIIALNLAIYFAILFTGCKGGNKAQLVKDAVLNECNYKLGDYVGDYSITDVNGNTYTFSQLLSEKKAIILNFWFISCGPCQMEFPYMQKSYNQYKDDVALIAINPIDAKEKDIQKYANDNSLSIPMAKGENAWVTAFDLRAFPTTIVIDRYGCISFYHVGSITEDGIFDKIFSFYTSDSYKKTIIKNIDDIK